MGLLLMFVIFPDQEHVSGVLHHYVERYRIVGYAGHSTQRPSLVSIFLGY